MTDTYLCVAILLLAGQAITTVLRVKQLAERIEWLEDRRSDHD